MLLCIYLDVSEVVLPHRQRCREVVLRGQEGGEAVVLGEGVLEHRLPQLKGKTVKKGK